MKELDGLIQDRKEKVRLMKKDGDNSHKLLAGLYGNPTHFITELLQNAEDEGANHVSFELTENELIFSHDAPKLFDFNDIRAISNFGDNQEKKEKPNAIGRFGIGFKSVYAITDNPRIVSAEFDVTIHDYNIPERTNGYNSAFFKGTKIILPFKTEANKRERTIKILRNELSGLNLNYLLFLSNIETINWKTPQNNGVYKKNFNLKDKRFISLKSSTEEIKYFLIEKDVIIDSKNLTIKLAFLLDKGDKRKIVPCDKSPLYVFFPTKIETNLKFLVHAPFYTTPARENIQEGDSLVNIETDHRNDELKKELGKLLSECLLVFKKLRLLHVDLLNALPIDDSLCQRSEIYKELYEAVKSELSSEKKLLPNSKGGFSSANELMLLGSSYLADLLTPKQSKKLFGRTYWLSKKITNDKTKLLRDYLYYDIDIPEYDLAGFANKIDDAFMTEQTDKWIIQFYKAINKAPALWRKGSKSSTLREKPIIRIKSEKGRKQIAPFSSDGKPKVFLPTKEKSTYPIVKPNITKDKDVNKFLEELGLTTPDIFAEINEFILPKFSKGELYPGYFEDIKKVLETSQSQNKEKRKQLIQDLREYPFILGYNPQTGEIKHLKYNEVYFRDKHLDKYFASSFDIYYVAEEEYSLNTRDHKNFVNLLTEIGVFQRPKPIKIQGNLSHDEREKLRRGKIEDYSWTVEDYELEGLDQFLKNTSKTQSISLWTMLSDCSIDFFRGTYCWTSKGWSQSAKFHSKFLRDLKNSKWLYNDKDKLVAPYEITSNELADDYKNGNVLLELLPFKDDKIKDIEERTGGKFIPPGEVEEYERWKSEQKNKNENNNRVSEEIVDGFTPELKPEEADLNTREIEEADINIEFNPNQGLGKQTENGGKYIDKDKATDDNPNNNKEKEKPSQKTLNDIGEWGENYVMRELRKEFGGDRNAEIVDLNLKGQKGIGADFKVIKDDEIIRLIEVKSTTDRVGQTLSISGTQWEIARNYFKLNDGDKYWIYCVFNAGSEYSEIVKIKNPIKKWKDGKLLAHPVNFIIK